MVSSTCCGWTGSPAPQPPRAGPGGGGGGGGQCQSDGLLQTTGAERMRIDVKIRRSVMPVLLGQGPVEQQVHVCEARGGGGGLIQTLGSAGNPEPMPPGTASLPVESHSRPPSAQMH